MQNNKNKTSVHFNGLGYINIKFKLFTAIEISI